MARTNSKLRERGVPRQCLCNRLGAFLGGVVHVCYMIRMQVTYKDGAKPVRSSVVAGLMQCCRPPCPRTFLQPHISWLLNFIEPDNHTETPRGQRVVSQKRVHDFPRPLCIHFRAYALDISRKIRYSPQPTQRPHSPAAGDPQFFPLLLR